MTMNSVLANKVKPQLGHQSMSSDVLWSNIGDNPGQL
jgi:hypothetical protein